MIRKEFFGGLFKWLPRSRTPRVSLGLAAVFLLMASAYPLMYGTDMFSEELLREMMTCVAAASMTGAVARVTWRR